MSCCEKLTALAKMSNKYGADANYVLAGGGNTSFKNADNLWIKGSGTALATIKPDDFVKMDRALLALMWDKNYPADEDEREAADLADMMDARVKGENRRPSVETLLHDLFPQQYILHVHPASVNGLTCSVEGIGRLKINGENRLFENETFTVPPTYLPKDYSFMVTEALGHLLTW